MKSGPGVAYPFKTLSARRSMAQVWAPNLPVGIPAAARPDGGASTVIPPNTESKEQPLTYERRTFASEVEHRSAGNNRRLVIGYAYKFRSLSEPLKGFRERILEGASLESIRADDIRGLLNHNADLVLGRNTAGTLKLAEDTTGLHYEIQADERQSYVRDLLISLERGDITQSSFGFTVNLDGEEWTLMDDGITPLRSITSLTLVDVGPVTYPAYSASEAGAA